MQTAKLFADGSGQAVRLPEDCRFHGDEVFARKIGEAVLLFPKDLVWETFLESVNGFTDDYFEAIESARADEIPSQKIPRSEFIGILMDKIWMSDDFDAPLNEMNEYME